MRSAIALSVAALAGSALAAPSYGRPQQVKNVHVVVETVVHTVYVTEGYQAYKPKPTSVKAVVTSQAPAETTVVYETYEAAQPTSSAVYVAPTVEAAKPTPTVVYSAAPQKPSTTAAAPSAAPTADGYMGIVSEWRAKLGLSALESDSKLESNALNCVTEGNGEMKHKLNAGSYGQVLAPGTDDMDSFLSVFVGGWLCEIPTLPGLDGVCTKMSQGWSYEGQTGHAEILTSENYSKIGCAFAAGIWGCDLA